MEERADQGTPKNIVNWLSAPYKYFGYKFGDFDATLLDAACGNRIQNEFLLPKFKFVYGLDALDLPTDRYYRKHDLNQPLSFFEDSQFDYVFSFETIEHLPEENHKKFVNELLRVCKKSLIIGTVSTDGPNYLGNDIIFKKSLNNNPFHLKEYSSWEFKEFFDKFGKVKYYSSILGNNGFFIQLGLNPKEGISNFVEIIKE